MGSSAEAPKHAGFGLRSLLLGAIGAFVSWSGVWLIHPIAYGMSDAASGLMLISSPVIVVLIALGCRVWGRLPRYLPRLFVAIRCVLEVCVFVTLLVGLHLPEPIPATLISIPIDLLLLALLPSGKTAPPQGWGGYSWLALGLGAPAIALLAWSTLNSKVIEYQANRIAGTAPFCIQIGTGMFEDYKAATRWGDLSGLRIYVPYLNGGGSDDYQWTFHAVLVVERAQGDGLDLYNWSFHAQNFLPISAETRGLMSLAANCQPSSDFFASLK